MIKEKPRKYYKEKPVQGLVEGSQNWLKQVLRRPAHPKLLVSFECVFGRPFAVTRGR